MSVVNSLAELYYQLSQSEEEKAQKEQNKAKIEAKLEILREAKRIIDDEKDVVKELKKAVQNQKDPSEAWAGQKRDSYCDLVTGDFKNHYKTYYGGVDDLLDSIVLEITQLENEARDLGGAIGLLADTANNIWGRIKTWVN